MDDMVIVLTSSATEFSMTAVAQLAQHVIFWQEVVIIAVQCSAFDLKLSQVSK